MLELQLGTKRQKAPGSQTKLPGILKYEINNRPLSEPTDYKLFILTLYFW